MLNEDKIRIMSRCAMYEKSEGKEDIVIHHYFQGDYIRLNTLKTLIGVTIGFLLCFVLYAIINAEYYMENIVTMDLMAFGKEILIIYAVIMAVFAVISIIFYGWKYSDAHKRVLGYYNDLQKLKSMDSENEMEDKK